MYTFLPSLPKVDKEEIGYIIRTKREELHMSRAVLSEQAQMSEYFLGEVERGEKMPSITYLRNLCYVLGISLDELLCLPPTEKEQK